MGDLIDFQAYKDTRQRVFVDTPADEFLSQEADCIFYGLCIDPGNEYDVARLIRIYRTWRSDALGAIKEAYEAIEFDPKCHPAIVENAKPAYNFCETRYRQIFPRAAGK